MTFFQTQFVSARHCRRGTSYILVLAIAAISSTIAIGALSISTVKRRTVDLERDFLQAGQVAESGIEHSLAQTAFEPNWRTAFSAHQNGNYTDAVMLGRGDAQWTLIDPIDGDITDNDSDPVQINSKATYGGSRRTVSITAIQQGRSLDVLRTAIHADGMLTIGDTFISGKGPASSNTAIEVTSGDIVGAAEAPVISEPANVSGSSFDGAPLKTMPARILLDVYRTMSGSIAIDELVPANTITGLVDAVTNPDGSNANPDGIYYVAVPPQTTLTISDCRIAGTLLIELTGENSKLAVGSGVVWQPSRSGFPALIVHTDQDLGTTVELNCSGTLVDDEGEEPASLKGLYHVIREVASPVSKTVIAAANRIVGSIVVDGDCDVAGVSQVVVDWDLVSRPPLGYTAAIDTSNRLLNGTIDEGLKLWASTSRNPNGFDTQLSPRFFAGSTQIMVTDRTAASSGAFQDVTQWVESDETFTGSIDVTTTSSDERAQVILEWSSSTGGIRRQFASSEASTSGSTIPFSFTPTWTGTLRHARLIINTTVSRQDFYFDNALIGDPRTRQPSNLFAVPTTWRIEASGL